MSESYENYIVSGSYKDINQEHKKEKRFEKQIESNLRVYPMVLALAISTLFDFLFVLSDGISSFMVEGKFQLNKRTFLAFIIQIGILLLMFVFFMYIPKLNQSVSQKIIHGFFGFFLALVLIGLQMYYNVESIYSFSLLILGIPLIVFLLFKSDRVLSFLCNVLFLLLSLSIVLVIADFKNIKNVGVFVIKNPISFVIFILINIVIVYYVEELVKVKKGMNKNIMRTDVRPLKLTKKD